MGVFPPTTQMGRRIGCNAYSWQCNSYYKMFENTVLFHSLSGYPLPRALGMQSNAITDDLISSSTEHSPPFRATSARLMGTLAWLPTTVDPDPWIQVNFVLTVTIIEILTQGRPHYNQWTKNYKVAFAQEASRFTFYRDETGQEKVKALQDIFLPGSRLFGGRLLDTRRLIERGV